VCAWVGVCGGLVCVGVGVYMSEGVKERARVQVCT